MTKRPWRVTLDAARRAGTLELSFPPAPAIPLRPMRFNFLILTTVILLAPLGRACFGVEPEGKPFSRRQPAAIPAVVVPGGYTRQAPANTSRALTMAIEDGLDAVELEVRRIKDGQHVIFDADKLDNKTSGTAGSPTIRWPNCRRSTPAVGSPSVMPARRSWYWPRPCTWRGRIGLVLVCRDVDPDQMAREISSAGVAEQVIVSSDNDLAQQVVKSSEGKILAIRKFAAATDKPALALVSVADASKENIGGLHDHDVIVIGDAPGELDTPATWDKLVAAGVDLVPPKGPRTSLRM